MNSSYASSSKTVLSTSDDPTRAQYHRLDTISVDISSDETIAPPSSKKTNRKSAKERLGERSTGPHFDFSGNWWLDPEILPHRSLRIQISKEINTYKKTKRIIK